MHSDQEFGTNKQIEISDRQFVVSLQNQDFQDDKKIGSSTSALARSPKLRASSTCSECSLYRWDNSSSSGPSGSAISCHSIGPILTLEVPIWTSCLGAILESLLRDACSLKATPNQSLTILEEIGPVEVTSCSPKHS